MPEPPELQAVVHAAEQAATDGDYVSAERLLREVVLLQEARLGPSHPELANTLNNLGVVCDFVDKPADAELCYRRAYAIAAAAFEPDHPFVATSRQNLEDFCRVRGRPLDPQSPARRRPLSSLEPPATDSVTAPMMPCGAATSDARTPRRFLRPLVVGALVAGGLVLVVLLSTGSWFRSRVPLDLPQRLDTVTSGDDRTFELCGPSVQQPPRRQPQRRQPPRQQPRKKRHRTKQPRVHPHRCRRSGRRHTSVGVFRRAVVGSATRQAVQSARLAVFLHARQVGNRFDRGTSLVSWRPLAQVGQAPVRANPNEGYRTYSRQTVDGHGAGDWRVELRAKDGTLVHEERFVVR